MSFFRRPRATGAHKCGLFCADNWIICGFGVFSEPFGVFFGVGHIGIDRFDGALGQAGVAVDASVGIDQ